MKGILIYSEDVPQLESICAAVTKIAGEGCTYGFSDPVKALAFAVKNPDIIGAFVDVDGPACDDFNLLHILRSISPSLQLVFMSASSKYGAQAFAFEATDYISLPASPGAVAEAVDKMTTRYSREKTSGLHIMTFGIFQVVKNGVAIPWKSSKTKELLAFLVDCRGADVSSTVIQKTLWPNTESKKAASVYHTTLHNLREKLEANDIHGLLSGTRGSQRVNSDAFECDFYEFEKEVETGTPESYMRAFDLYKGHYLENNTYHWSRVTRVRLEMQFEHILNLI